MGRYIFHQIVDSVAIPDLAICQYEDTCVFGMLLFDQFECRTNWSLKIGTSKICFKVRNVVESCVDNFSVVSEHTIFVTLPAKLLVEFVITSERDDGE